jgi:hypothetical protein
MDSLQQQEDEHRIAIPRKKQLSRLFCLFLQSLQQIIASFLVPLVYGCSRYEMLLLLLLLHQQILFIPTKLSSCYLHTVVISGFGFKKGVLGLI